MARPEFEPTEEQRRMVKSMTGLGTRQEKIAIVLEIAPQTLRKHFRKELDRGAIEADTQVANALYKMACSGKYPGASIFWLKTRCHWTERPANDSAEKAPPQFHIKIEEPKS